MKILQINAVNGVLSTGRTMQELADELNILGHESFIAYSTGKAKHLNSYKIGFQLEKKIHALCSRIFGLQAYFSIIATSNLIKHIKSINPDIVHLHNLHSNYINLNILLKYLSINNIATVITLHDCWFYTGRCSHYTLNKCYQWETCCYKCPNNNNNMPSWFFDRSQKMWKDKKKHFESINRLAVIGVSDWITNEAKRSFLSNANVIARIYNWVDLDVFKLTDESELRNSLKLIDKFVIIGVASEWAESKGLSDFIKLAGLIGTDSNIILVGNINKKIIFPKNIMLIPQTSNSSELARLYSMSDVFVSLSKEESFGKVIAEAIACGTPAIVYNSTACPELVGNGCGYVAMNNTIEEILNGIIQIKKNKKIYYSSNCRNFAAEKFDMHKCVKEYVKVFQTLLKQ